VHKFYLPPEATQQAVISLSTRDAHHALHVLRLRRDERVAVLDGAGNELVCQVVDHDRRQVRLSVLQRNFHPPNPHKVTLAQAIAKGKAMDLIIQKATELGISRLAPITSVRSVARPDDNATPGKLDRWQVTAIEAMKQCGLAWRPQIMQPQTVQEFLANGEQFELSLVGSLRKDARHPREHFKRFSAEHNRLPGSVCVWIGPEGDFSSEELDSMQAAGVLPINLGSLVLRSDTAAIYCLSILNYELQAPSIGFH
jgi:16S rRNA (uracil1498-N3)-methyltransferase